MPDCTLCCEATKQTLLMYRESFLFSHDSQWNTMSSSPSSSSSCFSRADTWLIILFAKLRRFWKHNCSVRVRKSIMCLFEPLLPLKASYIVGFIMQIIESLLWPTHTLKGATLSDAASKWISFLNSLQIIFYPATWFKRVRSAPFWGCFNHDFILRQSIKSDTTQGSRGRRMLLC